MAQTTTGLTCAGKQQKKGSTFIIFPLLFLNYIYYQFKRTLPEKPEGRDGVNLKGNRRSRKSMAPKMRERTDLRIAIVTLELQGL